jgi:hypothetical protein
MSHTRFLATCSVVLTALTGTAQAGTYYVSASGNDQARGTSVEHPWRTVTRVNRARLKPGDEVLFHGGDVFEDATLSPTASGTSDRRIVFGSYAGGRALLGHSGVAVWFSGVSYITFQGLDLTNELTDGAVVAGSPSGGSTSITIRGCKIHDTSGVGILSPTAADRSWLIVANTISHTGDSGIIVEGASPTIRGNAIVNTGWNGSIAWDKHAIYMKGPNATIAGNTISGFEADGISLRSNDATVTRNSLTGGPVGIAYFDFDDSVGTSKVEANTVKNVRTGFYFSRDPDAHSGANPMENFVIASNTFEASGGAAMDVTGARFSHLEISENVIRGRFDTAVAAYSPAGAGTYVERNNRIFGRGTFAWNGAWLAYSKYRAVSGQGRGDRVHALT